MLKNLFSASVFSLFLVAPGFADQVSVTVEIPLEETAEAVAAKEAALLEAAEKVCGNVKYAGILSFYAASARQDCIKQTYAKALADAETTKVLAKNDVAEPQLD